MSTVGIRKLKAELSHYIRQARNGERIEVTDRGEVVAQIVPASWGAAPNIAPGLLALAREGRVRLATKPKPKHFARYKAILPPGTVQRWLDEMREDKI